MQKYKLFSPTDDPVEVFRFLYPQDRKYNSNVMHHPPLQHPLAPTSLVLSISTLMRIYLFDVFNHRHFVV